MSKITNKLLIVVALSLVLFVTDSKSTSSQPLDLRTNHTCSTIATFPSNFCTDPEICSLITHTSSTGSTYVYESSSRILLVFSANGQSVQRYSLLELPQLTDFAVLDNGTIAAISGSAIYKYDPVTDTGKWLFSSRSFDDCSINDLTQRTAITVRKGSSLAAACYSEWNLDKDGMLKSPEIYRGIVLLDFADETSTEVIKLSWPLGSSPPWSVVLFGKDGRLYADIMDVSSPARQKMLVYAIGGKWTLQNPPDLRGTDLIIAADRYDPITSKWDVALIRDDVLAHLGRLYEVDSAGNLYFMYIPLFTHEYRITRINNTGAIDWVLTEQDLGSRPDFAGLALNGKLRLIERPTSTSQGQIKECSVDVKATSTATPSPRTTP